MTTAEVRAKIEAMTGPLEIHQGTVPLGDDPWAGKTIYSVEPVNKKVIAVFPGFNWGIGASDISLENALRRILDTLMLTDCLRLEEGKAGIRN